MAVATNNPKQVNPYQGLAQESFAFWGAPVFKNSIGDLVCPGFTGNTYANSKWDYVTIASQQTPGVCEVNVDKYRDVDKKKKSGTDGARITIHGIEPALIDIRITIWTPQQLQDLNLIWGYIFPKSSARPAGTSSKEPWPPLRKVSHPMFTLHGITSVQFVKGEGPVLGSVSRSRIFTIKAVEYLPPSTKNVTSTPVQPVGSLYDIGADSYPPPGGNNSGKPG